MVFSLFGRKDKTDSRKVREPMPARGPDTGARAPSGAGTVVDPREIARRTAAKIDQIESEMIAASGAATGKPGSVPATRPMPQGKPMIPGLPEPIVPAAAAAAPPAPELAPLEFSTSIVLGDTQAAFGGIQVNASSLPPDLEEASILFANGQTQPAAATLKAAIARGQLDGASNQAWLMLLDVLQATGAKAEFESVALDYAARFEKSPPAWQETGTGAPAVRRVAAAAVIAFPARLDVTVSRQVEQAERAAMNKRAATLDFSAVTSADAQGAAMVAATIADAVAGGRELTVLGAQRLFDAVRGAIEPGRRDDCDGAWQLALVALRLVGERQAFEDLSIDFCVTYEVSPPSWEPMPASIRTAAPEHVAAVRVATAAVEGSALVLRGELTGRIVQELGLLREHASSRPDVVVDCRALRRVDFVAAGELLNEVVALCGAGKSVLFVEPSPIVDALFTVMGIHEVAEIRRRRI